MRYETAPTLRAYRRLGARARVHTWVRWATAPLGEVAELLPQDGMLLDFGCGHGLLSIELALGSAERRIHAVDVDVEKLAVARRAAVAAGVADRVTFESVGDDWRPAAGAYDGVVVADVLYLFDLLHLSAVVEAGARSLRPSGIFVVKETADTPRWQRRLAEFQERVSVRVLRLTAGDRVRLPTEEELTASMRRAGLVVERRRLGRSVLHPHLALIGEVG